MRVFNEIVVARPIVGTHAKGGGNQGWRGREKDEEEGICSSGANYVNENGERIVSVQ